MIIIALSWVVLLLFCIPTGIIAKSIFKINTTDNYITIFLGMFMQCFGLSICSFFFKIGWIVFLINFLIVIGFPERKSNDKKKINKKNNPANFNEKAANT